jgi:hypothetical protein
MPEQIKVVDLGNGVKLAVAVEEQVGEDLVAFEGVFTTLNSVINSVETVCRDTLEAVKRAQPSKGTVELSFGLAVEQGELVALFGKGKGEATINVTLEWSNGAGAG